jgi:hypothetical protein
MLVGSEILGVVAGDQFFRLFLETVPAVVLTNFNRGTAHAAFITYGVGLGLVIFAWSLGLWGLDRLLGLARGLKTARAQKTPGAGLP